MLLLTGILPKLKSDPARDTAYIYKCIKSQCLDVTGSPVGPDGLGSASLEPAAAPGASVGSTASAGSAPLSLGSHLGKEVMAPHTPQGDGGALSQFHTQFQGSLSIRPDWVRQFEIDCLGCKARLPS